MTHITRIRGKIIFAYNGYFVTRDGRIIRIWDNGDVKYVPTRVTLKGRVLVNLFDGEKQHTHHLSRIVAFYWVKNPYNYPYVLHKDNNPQNNYYKNLIWGTPKMNSEQMVKEGRCPKPSNKIYRPDSPIVKKVYKLKQKGLSWHQIADKLNIPFGSVRYIYKITNTHG